MTFFARRNIEQLNKLKILINQRSRIKKQRMNRKIQKATLNYDLAEQYAPIMKLQENQTEVVKKGQEDQTRAIEDQTKILEENTTPATKSPTSEELDDEENLPTKAIDGEISDIISSLSNLTNTHSQMNISRNYLNHYKINDKPFELCDNILKLDDKTIRISPNFFEIV